MFSVSIQRGSYVLATAVGPADLTDLCGMAAFLGETARRTGSRQAVADLLSVRPLLTLEEHEQLGVVVSAILAGLQIAFVVPLPERVGVGESAAQRGGLDLKTFHTLGEAEQWLLESSRSA